MKTLTGIAARALYGLPFVVFGLFHLSAGGKMAGMVPSYVPGGAFWIYFTGACMLAAGLAILTGIQGRLAALLLAVLLLVYILTIHLPGLSNPAMRQMNLMELLKDTGLMGGALALAGNLGKKGDA